MNANNQILDSSIKSEQTISWLEKLYDRKTDKEIKLGKPEKCASATLDKSKIRILMFELVSKRSFYT